jgi:hypothetical protein
MRAVRAALAARLAVPAWLVGLWLLAAGFFLVVVALRGAGLSVTPELPEFCPATGNTASSTDSTPHTHLAAGRAIKNGEETALISSL